MTLAIKRVVETIINFHINTKNLLLWVLVASKDRHKHETKQLLL